MKDSRGSSQEGRPERRVKGHCISHVLGSHTHPQARTGLCHSEERGGVGGAAGANHSIVSLKVSAMKWGLLPVSHNALLVGDMAYYNFNGEMEQEADRINLQKCLGPTCKVWLTCSGKMLWAGTVKAAITSDTCLLDDV